MRNLSEDVGFEISGTFFRRETKANKKQIHSANDDIGLIMHATFNMKQGGNLTSYNIYLNSKITDPLIALVII